MKTIKILTETRHTDGSIVICTGTHVKVTKPNGVKKVYTVEKYRFIQVIKHVGAFLAAAAVMLTFCGMSAMGSHPAKPFAIFYCCTAALFGFALGLYLLIDSLIITRSGKPIHERKKSCRQKKN